MMGLSTASIIRLFSEPSYNKKKNIAKTNVKFQIINLWMCHVCLREIWLKVWCSQNVRDFLNLLAYNLDRNDGRSVIPLGHGDPSPFPSFRTDPSAVEAVCEALRSAKFNHYSTTSGLPLARK